MRIVRRLIAVAVFVAALVVGWRFADANLEPVRVDYLIGAIEDIPLWTALVGAFAAGGGLVGLGALLPLARLGLMSRRWRKAAHGLEAELHQLRNLPLASPSESTVRGSAGAPIPHAQGPVARSQ